MNVKSNDIPRQQLFFTNYWELYKKYYGMEKEETDELWEELKVDTDHVLNIYKNDDFYKLAQEMIISLICELHRKCEEYRQMSGKEKTGE